MKNFIAITFCVFIVMGSVQCEIATVPSQERNNQSIPKTIRIVKDKPTVYVSFERTGKREPLLNGESNEGVWLRLHNNTRWAINLEMNSVPQEYGDANLFYEVLSGNKVVVDMRCHVCSNNKLPGGKSILFSVPREYLDKDLAIRISFSYDWEADKRGSTSLEPQHYVYFYSSDLQKTFGSITVRPR